MKKTSPIIAAMDIITSLGDGPEDHFAKMLAGQTGLKPLTRVHSGRPELRVAGEITAESLRVALDKNDISFKTLALDLALRVGQKALTQAKTRLGPVSPDRLGLVLSTAKGEMVAFEDLWKSDTDSDHFNPYRLVLTLAEKLGLTGPAWAVSNACASGLVAIIQAVWMIEWGQADAVLVIGVDTLSEFVLEGFAVLRAVSPNPCRPFDQSRDGLSLGDGAAALVLARPDLADGPYEARLTGWGVSNDANHITGPSRTGLGLRLALAQALSRARLTPADIDCLNAHGTATLFNDEMEAQAYSRIFGPNGPPISAFKGFFGHTLGAAGVVEAVLTALTFRDSQVPAIKGYARFGVSLPIMMAEKNITLDRADNLVTAKAGFGGVNAVLVLSRPGSETRTGPKELPAHLLEPVQKIGGAENLVISAFGCLDRAGLNGSMFSGQKKDIMPGDWRSLAQLAFARNPCEHFGRVDPICKFALAVAQMLNLPPKSENGPNTDLGLVLGTEFGCYSIDADFWRSRQNPSGGKPLYFIYTLPSIALGEIAIRHGINGLNLCLMAGPESGLLALWQGYHLVANEQVPALICLAADAVEVRNAEKIKDPATRTRAENGFAYAFLLEKNKNAEKQGRKPLARLAITPSPPKTTREQTMISSGYLAGLSQFLGAFGPKDFDIPSPGVLKSGQTMIFSKITP